MQQWEALKEKTNEELFSLYQEDRRTEIKQELTLRYLYIVKAIAVYDDMAHQFPSRLEPLMALVD